MSIFVKVTLITLLFLSSAASHPRVVSLSGNRILSNNNTKEPQSSGTKQLFKDKCARCHGLDGRGQTQMGDMFDAPDFTDKEWWKEGRSNQRLIDSVRNGRGFMPKFEKKLTSQQITSLISYVRQFNKSSRSSTSNDKSRAATKQ